MAVEMYTGRILSTEEVENIVGRDGTRTAAETAQQELDIPRGKFHENLKWQVEVVDASKISDEFVDAVYNILTDGLFNITDSPNMVRTKAEAIVKNRSMPESEFEKIVYRGYADSGAVEKLRHDVQASIELYEALKEGATFTPPMLIGNFVVDGNHRIIAYKLANKTDAIILRAQPLDGRHVYSSMVMTERAQKIRGMITNVETWNPFCHGTASRFEEGIKSEGLKPRQCDGDVCRQSVYEGKLESQPDRVYLARLEPSLGTCLSSAGRAKEKFDGKPVVFGINLKREDEGKLDSDEDADWFIEKGDSAEACKMVFGGACSLGEETFRSSYFIDKFPKTVSDEILKETREHGCFTDEEKEMICSDLPKWVFSLISKWTLSHKGPVPTDRLRGPEPSDVLYHGGKSEEERKEAMGRLGRR